MIQFAINILFLFYFSDLLLQLYELFFNKLNNFNLINEKFKFLIPVELEQNLKPVTYPPSSSPPPPPPLPARG